MKEVSRELLLEEIRLLRERVSYLEEELRQTKEQVLSEQWEVPIEFKLTPLEKAILTILYRSKNTTSKDKLYSLLYANIPGKVPEIKIIDVLICKMRKKLKQFDIEIKTIWGQGYSLTPDSKTILDEWK
jgi:two-component system cell cycle response regulator CtrA